MDNAGNITIHQTLHGYNAGHTLIAASLEMSSDAKMAMLPISDMSGNSMIDGFEEYITGYPLTEINCYAIAKTWYAPEMERPGCVWTHTLLIENADLALIENFSDLISLFHRQVGLIDTSIYSRPFLLRASTNNFSINRFYQSGLTEVFLKSLISNLYTTDSGPVFIRGISSSGYDELILSFWFQQWPRLRRNFSFCTGAILPRSFKKKVLDLQVIPLNSHSGILQQSDNQILDSRVIPTYHHEEWVECIFNDLYSPSELRKFLRSYGADVAAQRNQFKLLVEVYLYFKKINYGIADIIKYLAEKFPSVKEAGTLKNTILGQGINNNEFSLPTFNETDILFELSTTEACNAFDYDKLKYSDRFNLYLGNNTSEFFNLLEKIFDSDLNVKGTQLIETIALDAEINENILGKIAQSKFATVFVSLNPKLAGKRIYWLSNLQSSSETLSALLKSDKNHVIDWQGIFDTLLLHNFELDLSVFELYNFDISNYILDYWKRNPDNFIQNRYLHVLKKNPKGVIDWINGNEFIHSNILKTVISILNPNSNEVISGGVQAWMMIENSLVNGNDELRIRLSAFCLALGLNINSHDAMILITDSFETVYNAIAEQRLPYSCWENLVRHTKPLPLFKDWDKCKKLVIAVVDYFWKMNYSLNDLTRKIQDGKLESRVWRHFNKRY